jgi:outer membrane lipoprotein-sorting protein
MKKIFTVVFLFISSLANANQEEIDKAQNYFNNLKSLESPFIQYNQDGGIFEGTFYLERPKFRLQYSIPNSLVVISDGKKVINYDRVQNDIYETSLKETPAYIVMRDNLRLQGADLTVSGVLQYPNHVRLTVVKTKEPEAGSITLVFQLDPYELRGWIVIDPSGNKTEVVLAKDYKTDIPLAANLFSLKNR